MIIKCTLIGEKGIGKTFFLNNILSRNCPNYVPTIGVDFCVYKHRSTKLCIWDTSGDKRFFTILKNFVLDSTILICMYKDKKSYDYVKNVLKKVNLNTVVKCIFINVGKKDFSFDVKKEKYYIYCDLRDRNSCIECLKLIVNTCHKKEIEKDRQWCSFWV